LHVDAPRGQTGRGQTRREAQDASHASSADGVGVSDRRMRSRKAEGAARKQRGGDEAHGAELLAKRDEAHGAELFAERDDAHGAELFAERDGRATDTSLRDATRGADMSSGDVARPVRIGWAERVDLPAWGIVGLRAKVDTGARSSALHVDRIEELDRDRVRFEVVLDRRHPDHRVTVETRIVRRALVRPSTGHSAVRLFVKAPVRIGPVEHEIEVSLAGRERMIFRMLIGRSALNAVFLVDVSERYVLSGKASSRRPRIATPEGSPERRTAADVRGDSLVQSVQDRPPESLDVNEDRVTVDLGEARHETVLVNRERPSSEGSHGAGHLTRKVGVPTRG
jgi:hypothetical protein